ncbi:hypothetical protein B195_012470 [Pseudomonas sp. Lz4W]|uniref:hypothetical protein n=1 Tax=Pseudomonas sp. Lz4W TaxID=1206777 RepID=UPI0005613798|nr:hypothetical protein [Pseudomonas sp. Lz4W]AUB75619.1 hypothetical protein B195_012470 [Pseudomonas sp. Lz4W]
MTADQYRYAQHNTRTGTLSRSERSRLYLFLKLDLEGASLEDIRKVIENHGKARKACKAN